MVKHGDTMKLIIELKEGGDVEIATDTLDMDITTMLSLLSLAEFKIAAAYFGAAIQPTKHEGENGSHSEIHAEWQEE